MKILATIIFIYALPTTCIAKCTQEMVKAEYKIFYEQQQAYLQDKTEKLDALVERIRLKNKLSEKEAFDYRINVLNNLDAQKYKRKEPDASLRAITNIQWELRCKSFQRLNKKLVKLADAQWEIVFDQINNDLKDFRAN